MARQAKSVRAGTITSSALQPVPRSKRDLKREAIIAAAKDLFFSEGYDQTSMNDIVARVGGSKATLYSHFSSKDELLLALVEHMTQPAIAEALSIDPAHDFTKFLRALGRITMHWLTSTDIVGMQRLAASEAIRFPEFGRTYYEQGIVPGLQQGAQLFKAAMDRGALRQADPLVAINQFVEMCTGWMWRRQIWNIDPAPSRDEIGARVDAAVETFMHGYATQNLPRRKIAKTRSGAKNTSSNAGLTVIATAVAREPKSRRELKRESIIVAAKDLFFKRGYAGVSMNDIVALVGGSKETLYGHFPSKQALLFAVVQDIESGHTLEFGGVNNAPVAQGPEQAFDECQFWLTGFGRTAVARLTSYEFISLQRLAAGEASQLPEVGKIFFEAGVTPAFAQFVGYFADAMERGVLRDASPALAAEHFIEMCTGWLMRRVIWGISPPPSEAQIAAEVDAAVEVFLLGYGTPNNSNQHKS